MMTRRIVFLFLLATGLTTCVAGHTQAQRPALLVGLEAAVYQTDNPYGETAGLGAMVGLERPVSNGLSLRATATVMRGLRTADATAHCVLAPDQSCVPRPVFPQWLSRVEVLGAFAPIRIVPLRIIAGGGVSIAGDARRPYRNSSALPLNTRVEAVWRVGADLGLGTSSRAPRIHFTRSGFSTAPFSLTFVDAIAVVFHR